MSAILHARIGDFCETGSGSTPPRDQMARYFDGGTIPWVKSGELRESIIKATEEHVTEAALKETAVKLVPVNALLVAMYGATVGRLGILGVQATTNQAVCHIVPNPSKADVRYLYRALETKVSEMLLRTVGGAQPNINQGIVRDLRIPLPPLQEQRRIAAILDQAETLRTQRRQALAHLDTLTQSLFLDMFGDPITEPNRWSLVVFDQIVKESRIGLVRGSQELDPTNPYQYLRMNAIGRDGELKLEGALMAKASSTELDEYRLRRGDFLFNTRNSRELVGKTALFRSDDIYLFNNNLMRVRFTDQADPEYVFAAFKTRFVQSELEVRKSGTTNVFAVYYKDLRSLPIPLPPLALQQTFATRIAAIEALKATHRTALAQLDALFASLQQKAFSGELTATTDAAASRKQLFAELGKLDPAKGLEALVYAAKRLKGKGHYFATKVQYIADRHHLKHHGRPIYGETYVNMPHGPVPQAAFNASRALADDELICEFGMDDVRKALRREGDELIALRDAKEGVLSAEERQSLDWAIRYVQGMSFTELKTATHDSAYNKTPKNQPIAWQDIIASISGKA